MFPITCKHIRARVITGINYDCVLFIPILVLTHTTLDNVLFPREVC